MVNEMNKFSESDLTVNLTVENEDEIGKLYNGFNSAVKNIKEMIIDLSRFGEIPFLTKEILRARYDDLKSDDLSRRGWFEPDSGAFTRTAFIR